jgi:serine/threonine-protein kinase
MAQVWVARLQGKHGFEKLVAIKSILPKYASDPQFQKMFLDEARIASGIEHTNVAQIFDLGDEHGVLYLAMEWVDGDALSLLHRALEKKAETIPTGVLLRIIADTCGGLHAAHELKDKDGRNLGVVHRDVSPQNILVSARGVAKLIDFGIAKARDRSSGETTTGTFKGKVHYMAPEQALGLPVDSRADVWAVGAILYHLLAGKLPFDGGSQLATLHLLATATSCPPLPGQVPPAVADIVKRALAVDRDQRYATAAEIQVAMESAMVSSQLVTSTSEVAAFIEKHMADRAARRREAIDFALTAAEERARVQELLKPPGLDSSISKPGEVQLVQARSERLLTTVPDGLRRESRENFRAPSSAPPPATLGITTVESSIGRLPIRRHRNVLVAVVGVAGVVLGIVATVMLRGGSQGSAEGASGTSAANASPTLAPAASVVAPSAVAATPASPAPPPSEQLSAAAASSGGSAAGPAPSSAPAHAPTATRAVPVMARPAATTPGTATAKANANRKIPKVIDNGF